MRAKRALMLLLVSLAATSPIWGGPSNAIAAGTTVNGGGSSFAKLEMDAWQGETAKAPYNSLKDLVDAAKKSPGKLNWGYPGAGTTQHLTGELFKYTAGVDIQGVMYKGSAQVVQDLLGDSIELSVDGVPANLPHIKSGKFKAIASTGSVRAPQLPDVPTVAEQGYPGFSGEGWGGVVAAKGTPPDIVAKVSADLRKVLSDPVVQKRLVDNGLMVDNQPRDEWIAFAKTTLVQWGDVARRANIKVD